MPDTARDNERDRPAGIDRSVELARVMLRRIRRSQHTPTQRDRAMRLLTRRQLERLRELERDHRVVGERYGSPILESPDGRVVLLQPTGKLAAASPVSPMSYLDVERR